MDRTFSKYWGAEESNVEKISARAALKQLKLPWRSREGRLAPAQIPKFQLLETAQLMSDTLQLVVDQPWTQAPRNCSSECPICFRTSVEQFPEPWIFWILSGGKSPFLTCIYLSLRYFSEDWVMMSCTLRLVSEVECFASQRANPPSWLPMATWVVSLTLSADSLARCFVQWELDPTSTQFRLADIATVNRQSKIGNRLCFWLLLFEPPRRLSDDWKPDHSLNQCSQDLQPFRDV